MLTRRATISAPLGAALGATLGLALGACTRPDAPPTSEPPPNSIAVVHAPKAPGGRGTGWYPNVEVDDDNRLHLAWVDADPGDVLYATSAKGGGAIEGAPAPVDVDGAVGGFLRLALGPGGAPAFSYVRQDHNVLRFAWRAADRARMKEAGGDVDVSPLPELPKASNQAQPIQGAPGFVVEEVGFGDQVGRGSSLALDVKGRMHLAYYAADDRLRLARRPADVPAFAAASLGVLEKRDVDPAASSSSRVLADVLITSDGTVVISYCHDVVTDARLRVAVLAPGAERFVVIGGGDDGPSIALEGLISSVHARTDGGVDVTSLDKSERAAFVRTLDLTPAPAWRAPRAKLFDVEGTAVIEKRADGFYGLVRVKGDGKADSGGVFLYVVDDKGPSEGMGREVRRIRLDGGGAQDDAWLDLVVRPDGRPAAVWFDQTSGSLKLYAP
ncbi:MAG: hypothetical protein Q8O67_05480 [Deltaproteobacteria bacterium]|nr:hypothetical protein [Deltaproteobacteria bacterium]